MTTKLIPTYEIILTGISGDYRYGDYVGNTIIDLPDWYMLNKPDRFYRNRGRKAYSGEARYPCMMWRGKLQDVHKVVGYLNSGKWSIEGVTAWHHKDNNKMNARWNNLELVDWNHQGDLRGRAI